MKEIFLSFNGMSWISLAFIYEIVSVFNALQKIMTGSSLIFQSWIWLKIDLMYAKVRKGALLKIFGLYHHKNKVIKQIWQLYREKKWNDTDRHKNLKIILYRAFLQLVSQGEKRRKIWFIRKLGPLLRTKDCLPKV